MRPSPRGGGGGGERAAGTTARIGTDSRRPRGRCCVKRSEARSATRRQAKSSANPRGGGQTPSRQARAPAHATRGVRAACKARSSGAAEQGAGGPAVPLNRLRRAPPRPSPAPQPRCLPTFSEPSCHRTSSSWKLPLGSAPRMPNSGSQGGWQPAGARGPRATAAPAAPLRRLPTPRRPEGARAGGHLLPAAGREAPGAGARRLTAHPRPPARSASPLAPRGVPAAPPPARPPDSGAVAPAPPPPRRPLAELPGRWSRPGGAPPPGQAACGRCPSAGAGGPLPRRARLIHAKLIPAASRPPARGRAPASAEPRSLHPPPPPPPGGGVPGARPAKCQLPGRRGAAGPGPRRPPRPPHFYRRGRRARPGRPVPASRARAPGPLRAAALLRPRRPRRACQPATWFPLRPARRRRRRPAAGRPGSSRGAARKWPPGRAPGEPAGPRRPRPRRARRARPRAPRPRAPGAPRAARRLRTCRPRRGRPGPRPGRALRPGVLPPAAMSRPFWWPRVHPPGCVRREVRARASFL